MPLWTGIEPALSSKQVDVGANPIRGANFVHVTGEDTASFPKRKYTGSIPVMDANL